MTDTPHGVYLRIGTLRLLAYHEPQYLEDCQCIAFTDVASYTGGMP